MSAIIRSTGLWTPDDSVTNEELVECFNAYVEQFNAEHASAIEHGSVEPLNPSSVSFIEKASGIKSRYTVDKAGVLDVNRMRPEVAARSDDELSLMAEAGLLPRKTHWKPPAVLPPMSTRSSAPPPPCSAPIRASPSRSSRLSA